MDLTKNLKVYKSSRMFMKSLPLISPEHSKIQLRLCIPFTKKANPPIDFGPRVLPPTRHASEALALATTFVTSTPHFLREAISQVVITSHPTTFLVWYLLFRKEKGSLSKENLDMYHFFGRFVTWCISANWSWTHHISPLLGDFSCRMKIARQVQWKLTGLRETHPRTLMYIFRSNVYQTKKNV